MKKLKLNKEVITNLDSVRGGKAKQGFWTTGCSDGCSLLQTVFRCTKADCTADCGFTNECQEPYKTVGRCRVTDGDYSCRDCR